jgi:hypothetical protein
MKEDKNTVIKTSDDKNTYIKLLIYGFAKRKLLILAEQM